MRRVLVLVLLLAVIGIGAVAVLVLGSDSGGDDADATPESGEVVDGEGGEDGEGNGSQEVQATPTPDDLIQVVVAVRNINRGETIDDEDVDIRFWPEGTYEVLEGIPEARPIDLEGDVIGSLARTDIPAFTPIYQTQITGTPQQLASIGSDLATIIQSDRVAISVPLDPTGIGQIAYAMQPGDIVDIIMTFAFIDVDEFFQTRIPNTISILALNAEGNLIFTPPVLGVAEQRLFELDIAVILEETGQVNTFRQTLPGAIGPSETVQRPRLVTDRIIEQARILYVGWFPEDGQIYGIPDTPTPFLPTEEPTPVGTPPEQEQAEGEAVVEATPTSSPYVPLIVTVELEPQDAVVLTWAIESGLPLTFAMRNADQDQIVPGFTEPVSLSYMVRTFELPDPSTLRLTYALEPRPNIRRFELSTLQQFAELEAETAPGEININDPLRVDLLREVLFIGSSISG